MVDFGNFSFKYIYLTIKFQLLLLNEPVPCTVWETKYLNVPITFNIQSQIHENAHWTWGKHFIIAHFITRGPQTISRGLRGWSTHLNVSINVEFGINKGLFNSNKMLQTQPQRIDPVLSNGHSTLINLFMILWCKFSTCFVNLVWKTKTIYSLKEIVQAYKMKHC